ncbi:2-oxo acid dehydrogenase subunit E2 [Haloferax profundi]|uniref:Dehydrogenase n=1 Tax=Haloferax profundi TaxID=1544718 RepID=A0A0W1R474_9EURY|nr:2-oxo acid dehydrogenase subunit E2 [Haloferax profundi]KTG08238.1 dehydrogenase [Haloferax profundi]
MRTRGERIEPLPPRRRGTVDYMRVAGKRSNVHGLVEFDVTDARDRLRTIEEETGDRLSFTAFVVVCLARAIDDHPHINAYRDWRGRVHVFDDVDVNVLVETTIRGSQIGAPHVVRGANRRSLRSVHDEIRTAQASADPTELSRASALGLRLPGFVRRLVWRLPQSFPRRWKEMAGTVSVTSVGMFGSGGGWAITPTNYTVQVAVGGISTKPRFVDGELETREFLHLTVTFDHDIVDGAPATRFVKRFGELVEDAHGIPSQDEG